MHTTREWPLCTHNRTEIASLEKHEREISQKQVISHSDSADTLLPCQKSQPVWGKTPSESPLCIPNIKSSSSVTEKLLLNDKYQVQSVANAYMRAVKRINLCWGYLSWSYFSWLFHLTDYSWTLLRCPWSVTVYRVIAGRLQGSSKSFVVWIRTKWFCNWRILQRMLKMQSILRRVSVTHSCEGCDPQIDRDSTADTCSLSIRLSVASHQVFFL